MTENEETPKFPGKFGGNIKIIAEGYCNSQLEKWDHFSNAMTLLIRR